MIPLPPGVVIKGMSKSSAKCLTWSKARELTAPPPATITGLSAFIKRTAASSISWGSPEDRCGYLDGIYSGMLASVRPTSLGISMKTGPGFPLAAREKARLITHGARSGKVMRSHHFVRGFIIEI